MHEITTSMIPVFIFLIALGIYFVFKDLSIKRKNQKQLELEKEKSKSVINPNEDALVESILKNMSNETILNNIGIYHSDWTRIKFKFGDSYLYVHLYGDNNLPYVTFDGISIEGQGKFDIAIKAKDIFDNMATDIKNDWYKNNTEKLNALKSD